MKMECSAKRFGRLIVICFTLLAIRECLIIPQPLYIYLYNQ